jgi:hypothetical protein
MSEVPLTRLWVTIFLTLWASVGPLVGILIGHHLVKSWQRRQWLADNQKEEYRRVLAGLNRVNMALSQQYCYGNVDAQEIKQALEELTIALNTTLFIREFLEESKVAGNVLAAIRKLDQGGSFDDYHKEYWKAINLIIASAEESTL